MILFSHAYRSSAVRIEMSRPIGGDNLIIRAAGNDLTGQSTLKFAVQYPYHPAFSKRHPAEAFDWAYVNGCSTDQIKTRLRRLHRRNIHNRFRLPRHPRGYNVATICEQ